VEEDLTPKLFRQKTKGNRKKIIKNAIGVLIGPTEIAPEVMVLIKKIQIEQTRVASEVDTIRMLFKTLEGLRLEEV
jgi:hypothetical protein